MRKETFHLPLNFFVTRSFDGGFVCLKKWGDSTHSPRKQYSRIDLRNGGMESESTKIHSFAAQNQTSRAVAIELTENKLKWKKSEGKVTQWLFSCRYSSISGDVYCYVCRVEAEAVEGQWAAVELIFAFFVWFYLLFILHSYIFLYIQVSTCITNHCILCNVLCFVPNAEFNKCSAHEDSIELLFCTVGFLPS